MFEQYRKAIGGFIGGALPLVTLAVPGVGDFLRQNPEILTIGSAVFGGLGAFFPANRVNGRNVMDAVNGR